MKNAITVSLPEKLRAEIDRIAETEGISRSDIVRESVRNYLFIRQFRSLRAKMLPKAASQGVHADEDVFDRVS